MAKTKDQLFGAIDGEVFEITGEEKETLLTKIAEAEKARVDELAKQEKQKALKISAYTKLGLTEEEINAIL
jgi:flagellar capping protein FliD